MTVAEHSTDLMKLAEELDGKVRAICGIVRQSTMAIGWYARTMKEFNLFPLLGYEDEKHYLESLDIAQATWYHNIQLAEGYKRLDRDVYMTMQPTKAFKMLDLPESERIKPEWIALAADPNVTASEVACRIEGYLLNGGRKDATSRRPRSWFRCRMDDDAKVLVEEELDNFCHENGLGDDRGRALELMIVDANRFGAAVLKVWRDRFEEFKAMAELLENANRPYEERCKAYEKFAKRFICDMGKACSRAETVQ
jgi:hypothetical protein